MSMFRRATIFLSLVLAKAVVEEPQPSCAGEASLMQKQSHVQKVGVASSRALYEDLPENVLGQMIMSNPWHCDLLPPWDIWRLPTCNLNFVESGLHPARTTANGNTSHDHKNAMRTLFTIGSLPCCSTMPFCSAPACAVHDLEQQLLHQLSLSQVKAQPSQASLESYHRMSKQIATLKAGKFPADMVADMENRRAALLDDAAGAAKPKICTKREAGENLAYMSSADVWPAYHGWGGSFDMDVQKHFDILHTVLVEDDKVEPFDMVIDIGANSGFVTEKLTARHFAKSYILVEAYHGMKTLFDQRFGNPEWKQRWFTEQVPHRAGAQVPELEFLNFAVNSKSEGTVDLCTNSMWSAMNNNVPCPVDKLAMDDMVPGRLSPTLHHSYTAAQSAYVKIDVEGMDELTLRGMTRILQEERGAYKDKSPRHLVNFIQLEYAPILMQEWKDREGLSAYDLKTVVFFLESMGFETFLMGPRYLPLSHGSWSESFKLFTEDAENSWGGMNFPQFLSMACPGPECPSRPPRNILASDLFAMRTSHPKASQIKIALGACKESKDFDLADKQYRKDFTWKDDILPDRLG